MKRFALLLPAVVIPLLTVFSCGKSPERAVVETVQTQIDEHAADLRERFDALPQVKAPVAAPKRVTPKKAVKPHTTKRKAVKPLPAPPKDEERLPPQQGVICIFPFNMVPSCTPQQAG